MYSDILIVMLRCFKSNTAIFVTTWIQLHHAGSNSFHIVWKSKYELAELWFYWYNRDIVRLQSSSFASETALPVWYIWYLSEVQELSSLPQF